MNALQPHEERVVLEKDELDARLRKARGFIMNLSFMDLPQAERVLLVRQVNCMDELSNILRERIAIFRAKAGS